MNYVARSLKCCGLSEIDGLNTPGRFSPTALFKWIMNKYQYVARANLSKRNQKAAGRSAFILTYAYDTKKRIDNDYIFHAPTRTKKICDQRTKSLETFINRHKLGVLTILPDTGNPNYYNETMIRTMIFTPDQKAMLEFCRKKKWDQTKGGGSILINYWINGE